MIDEMFEQSGCSLGSAKKYNLKAQIVRGALHVNVWVDARLWLRSNFRFDEAENASFRKFARMSDADNKVLAYTGCYARCVAPYMTSGTDLSATLLVQLLDEQLALVQAVGPAGVSDAFVFRKRNRNVEPEQELTLRAVEAVDESGEVWMQWRWKEKGFSRFGGVERQDGLKGCMSPLNPFALHAYPEGGAHLWQGEYMLEVSNNGDLYLMLDEDWFPQSGLKLRVKP